MPDAVKHTPQPRGRPHGYPWSHWIERLNNLPCGESLRFIEGQDFSCSPKSFRSNWYNRDMGVICNIVIENKVASVLVSNKE